LTQPFDCYRAQGDRSTKKSQGWGAPSGRQKAKEKKKKKKVGSSIIMDSQTTFEQPLNNIEQNFSPLGRSFLGCLPK